MTNGIADSRLFNLFIPDHWKFHHKGFERFAQKLPPRKSRERIKNTIVLGPQASPPAPVGQYQLNVNRSCNELVLFGGGRRDACGPSTMGPAGNSKRSRVPFHSPPNIRNSMMTRARRILLLATRLCAVAVLAASVCLSLLPRFAIAAGLNSCCVGKSESHWCVSLRKRRKVPKPEPMCGLKPSPSSNDEVTVIADDAEQTSNQPAVTNPNACRDCPTCSLGSKPRTRYKTIIPVQQPIRQESNVALLPGSSPNSFRPQSQLKPISPRGPPLS